MPERGNTAPTVYAKDAAPGKFCETVTPSDSANYTSYATKGLARAIYVGGSGDVALVTEDDQVHLFLNVSGILPMESKRVNLTNTNATAIKAIW